MSVDRNASQNQNQNQNRVQSENESGIAPIDELEALPQREGSYYSSALGSRQPYLYVAPPNYRAELHCATDTAGASGDSRRYPLLILLHGLRGDHSTWLKQTDLARYAAQYEMFIVCPEGREGWYTNAIERDEGGMPPMYGRYEDDLIQDLVPHLQSTFPLQPPGRHWAIGGMSMGGYGALKIALTHGRLFSLALSHSGAFEYPQQQGTHPVFGDRERDLLARRAANVFKLAEDALSTWPPARPNLYFDCGQNDRWLTANQHLHQHLDFIGYRHTYIEQPGYHTLPYWNRAIREALPLIWEAIGEKAEKR